MKLRIKILVGFMAVIVLMGILGVVTYSNFLEINEQFEFLIEHDLEVLQNAQQLQKYIVDAETGQRGFIIVGEESFLEPYYSGISGFKELVKIEKHLVSDNPPQVERLERIEGLFNDWNKQAATQEIELARIAHNTDINSKTLQNLLAEGTGKGILDKLRILIDGAIEREVREGDVSQQVILFKISKNLVDRETGQRGFLITGEESFLEPYHLGNKNLADNIVKLRVLVGEEEVGEEEVGEEEVVNQIEALAKQWEIEAAIPEIELARKIFKSETNQNYLTELISEGTGKGILDELRLVLDRFIEHEVEEGDNKKQLILFKISKDLVDRETGQRGFLITGEESFLEPYQEGNKNLADNIVKLRVLVGEEEVEVEVVNQIEALAKQWEIEAAIPEINARKIINENPTIYDVSILLKSETGKNILDNIRVEFTEFIQIENNLKDKRFETVEKIKESSEINIAIFVTIAAIIGILIAMILSHSINKSLNMLILGTKRFGKGEFEPIPTSGDDEISELSDSFNEMALNLKTNIEQLEIQKDEVDQMNQEMKKTDILKEEFVAMISHELKTPLTPILMWSEALQDKKMLGELNEKQIKATKTIFNCATELSELISDIFDSYKLDLEKIEFNEHEINLMELMNSTKDTAEKLIGRYNIIIENTTNENITIYSDKKRINQIFKNLITNAIDFVEQDTGKIEINASVKGEDVEFRVKDNGIGIKKEFQKELFKKFYQIDTSATRKHGGSGLGLSICHGMVKGMKGKIWVESEHMEGTTFYFTLPIVNKTVK